MLFNTIFNEEHDKVDWKKYWEELGINYLKINENKDLNNILKGKVETLPKSDKKIMAEILEIKCDEENCVKKYSKI